LPGFSRCAGAIGDAGDAEVGVADDTHDARVEFLLEILRERVDGGGRQGEGEGVAGR